ncbi:hypothetical protein D3C72_1668430 [compost metagenome]
MAHHARVAEERLGAAEDMHVGAADADAAYAQQHFTLAGHGHGALFHAQTAGGIANDTFHHGRLSRRPDLAGGILYLTYKPTVKKIRLCGLSFQPCQWRVLLRRTTITPSCRLARTRLFCCSCCSVL